MRLGLKQVFFTTIKCTCIERSRDMQKWGSIWFFRTLEHHPSPWVSYRSIFHWFFCDFKHAKDAKSLLFFFSFDHLCTYVIDVGRLVWDLWFMTLSISCDEWIYDKINWFYDNTDEAHYTSDMSFLVSMPLERILSRQPRGSLIFDLSNRLCL